MINLQIIDCNLMISDSYNDLTESQALKFILLEYLKGHGLNELEILLEKNFKIQAKLEEKENEKSL